MELLLILTIVVVSVRTATPDAILNLDVFFSEKGDGEEEVGGKFWMNRQTGLTSHIQYDVYPPRSHVTLKIIVQ